MPPGLLGSHPPRYQDLPLIPGMLLGFHRGSTSSHQETPYPAYLNQPRVASALCQGMQPCALLLPSNFERHIFMSLLLSASPISLSVLKKIEGMAELKKNVLFQSLINSSMSMAMAEACTPPLPR